jgi:divalent metal cation (Fe/Co/Zn/Cd) transporter
MTNPLVNFIVLGLAFLFEGTSWVIALREFARTKGKLGWWQAMRASKDPSTLVVLCEDSAALLGLVIATAAIAAALVTGDPRWDGAGSILIGIVLVIVAIILARETKGLLIGERASLQLIRAIRDIAESEPDICKVSEVRTAHMAPDQVLAVLSVDFNDNLRTRDIETRVQNIEDTVRKQHEEVRGVFIRPISSEQIG